MKYFNFFNYEVMFMKKLLLVISIFATVLNMQASDKRFNTWKYIKRNISTPAFLWTAAFLKGSSNPRYPVGTGQALACGMATIAGFNLVHLPLEHYLTNRNDSKDVLYQKSLNASTAIIAAATSLALLAGTEGNFVTNAALCVGAGSLVGVLDNYLTRTNNKQVFPL